MTHEVHPYPEGGGWHKSETPAEGSGESLCPKCGGFGWIDESDRTVSYFACTACEMTGIVTDFVRVFLENTKGEGWEINMKNILPGLKAAVEYASETK